MRPCASTEPTQHWAEFIAYKRSNNSARDHFKWKETKKEKKKTNEILKHECRMCLPTYSQSYCRHHLICLRLNDKPIWYFMPRPFFMPFCARFSRSRGVRARSSSDDNIFSRVHLLSLTLTLSFQTKLMIRFIFVNTIYRCQSIEYIWTLTKIDLVFFFFGFLSA